MTQAPTRADYIENCKIALECPGVPFPGSPYATACDLYMAIQALSTSLEDVELPAQTRKFLTDSIGLSELMLQLTNVDGMG